MISAQGEIDLGKAILNDLFDLFALREKAAGYARYLTAMPLEQLFERYFIAGTGRGHQHIVRWFFTWLHNLFSDGFAEDIWRSANQSCCGDVFFQLMR